MNNTYNPVPQHQEMKYINTYGFYPYKERKLLTNNEYRFYYNLVQLADKYNLSVQVKMRLADIIEVDKCKITNQEYMSYFGKIKSKHIDFVLTHKYNMQMIAAIELDDKSHQKQNRIERDAFVNNALTAAGIDFIRSYNFNINSLEPILIYILRKKNIIK